MTNSNFNLLRFILLLINLILCCCLSNETFENFTDSNYNETTSNYTMEVTTLNQELEFSNISDTTEANFTELDPVVIENWENYEGPPNRKYLSFTTPDEDICSCDLHSNICDINCCCDSDCSEEDMKVFSECYSQVMSPDKNYCYQTDIIFKNNTVYKMVKDPESSLFCIVHDNLKIHLRFKDMPLIKSHRDLDLVLKYQSKSIYSWDGEEKKEISEWSETRAGNLIYIDYLSPATKKIINSNWRLPSACFTRACSCMEDVHYLEDFKSSCNRIISNLELECKSQSVLAADYYANFCISMRSLSQDIHTSLNDLITHSKVTYSINENNTQVCSEKNSPQPIYLGSACRNVVKSVHFMIIHNGFRGIHSIETAFEYTEILKDNNINISNIILVQSFSVSFQWYNITDSVERSGNPGYKIGFPILVGTNNSLVETEDLFSLDVKPNGLTVLNSDSGSLCSKTHRSIVKFGRNLKTSCILKYSKLDSGSKTVNRSASNKTKPKLDCSTLQERIFDLLLDSSKTQVFVGVFGNANQSNFDDWIEAYHEDHELSSNDETCFLITSLKINIAYAAVGTVVNPQHKILGVGYHYSKPISIDLSDSPNLILSTSVSFFDTTEPAISLYPKVPSIKANLPSDFFYPFLYGKEPHFLPNLWLVLYMSLFLSFL